MYKLKTIYIIKLLMILKHTDLNHHLYTILSITKLNKSINIDIFYNIYIIKLFLNKKAIIFDYLSYVNP
jgi:hypothetical protein